MTGAVLDDPQVRSFALGKISEVETLTGEKERVVATDDEARTKARAKWVSALGHAVIELAGDLPADTEDFEVRQLLFYLHKLKLAVEEDPVGGDERGEVALATMQMADVARRLGRRFQHSWLEVPENAAAYVLRHLSVLSASELSELLGVSTKTLGAWRAGNPVRANVERVVVVARLVAYLRTSMTPRGVLLWFTDEHDRLDGRRPIDLLDTPSRATTTALIQLARGGRAQLAD